MERWVGRVALVTGASAGIGAAIAYQLQDAGVHVIAVARRKEKIPSAVEIARKEAAERGRTSIGKATTPGKLYALKCDVSKESDVVEVFSWAKNNVGGVDILINNAGIIGEGKLYDAPSQEWKNILDLNVFGLSICTREALQQMKSRGVDDGHIIHISSICSHIMPMGGVSSAMYFASKHAVRVLTEGLRKELVEIKSRIRVTQICPGSVKTEIWDPMTKMTGEEWFKNPHLQSEDCADATLYALATPPHVQIHDIILKPVGEEF